MKCATILGNAPSEVERLLKSAAPAVRKNLADMRQLIKDFELGQVRNFAPSAESSGPAPMDVGAIGRSEVKCNHCGKKGHTKAECFHVIGFPTPGGKAGSKGKLSQKGKRKGKFDKGKSKESIISNKILMLATQKSFTSVHIVNGDRGDFGGISAAILLNDTAQILSTLKMGSSS